jgi:anti-anti-sigma factor
MTKHDSSPTDPVLVLRLHSGGGSQRTDIVQRNVEGEEVLLHRHESAPGLFGLEDFKRAMAPILAAGVRHAVIDLVELRWAPSEVVETLLIIETYLRDGGVATVIARPNSRVMSVLTITGLVRLMEIRDSMDEAVASLGPAADAAGAD